MMVHHVPERVKRIAGMGLANPAALDQEQVQIICAYVLGQVVEDRPDPEPELGEPGVLR